MTRAHQPLEQVLASGGIITSTHPTRRSHRLTLFVQTAADQQQQQPQQEVHYANVAQDHLNRLRDTFPDAFKQLDQQPPEPSTTTTPTPTPTPTASKGKRQHEKLIELANQPGGINIIDTKEHRHATIYLAPPSPTPPSPAQDLTLVFFANVSLDHLTHLGLTDPENTPSRLSEYGPPVPHTQAEPEAYYVNVRRPAPGESVDALVGEQGYQVVDVAVHRDYVVRVKSEQGEHVFTNVGEDTLEMLKKAR